MEQYVELDDVEKKYLEKLKLSDTICGKILGLEDIDNSVKNKIGELQKKNERILKKLRTQEFNVAVIGQESSGKSTVLNALMNMIALPDDTGRCTFTTTTIKADSRDYAEVFFYSFAEFRANFAEKMSEMGYEGDADFDNIDARTFRSWLEDKKNSLSTGENSFSDKQVNIADDVSNILNDKATVKEFLRGGSIECNIGTEEFRLFITGRKNFNDINRTAHPYAVKEIIIHSTQLKLEGMANMILFDVPGFNSTTEMHKEQTYDKLRTADAIIMTKDMQQDPNIVDSELHILRHEEDEEKIPLYEKLFVFGNKHDMAVSDDGRIANRNKDMFMRDIVEKYHLADRAVVGSAKIHLIRQNKFTDEDKDSPGKVDSFRRTSELMKTLGISDGIEELNEKLRYYYKHDRSRIRKKRAETILNEITEYLGSIAQKYRIEGENNEDPSHKLLQDVDSKLKIFASEANEIVKNNNREIMRNKEFSELLKKEIGNIFPYCNSKDPDFLESIGDDDSGADDAGRWGTVDEKFREKLKTRYLRALTQKVAVLTSGRQKQIRGEIVSKLLELMSVNERNSYYDELRNSAEKLITKILEEVGQNTTDQSRLTECRFDPLVDRFTRFLVDALILHGFTSNNRKQQVLNSDKAKFEILSIAVYYTLNDEKDTFDVEKRQQTVMRKILAHEGINSIRTRNNGDGNALKRFFDEHKKEIFQVAATAVGMSFPYAKWAGLIASFGGAYSLNSTWVKEIIMKIGGAKEKLNAIDDKDKEKRIVELIDYVLEKYEKPIRSTAPKLEVKATDNLRECLDELSKLPERRPQSETEIVDILNQDIQVLRDIMIHAAIRAMGLERTFISITTNNKDFIRDEALRQEPDSRFREWTRINLGKIRYKEMSRVNEEVENRKRKKDIYEQITLHLQEMSTSVIEKK